MLLFRKLMQRLSLAEADRWAIGAVTVAGFLTGTLAGLLVAPDIQRDLAVFGVSQTSFGPAAIIIALAGVAGALLVRR